MKSLEQEDIIFNMDTIDLLDKDLAVNETVQSTIEIKYKPAKFFRRIMANLFDFIIFILVFIALFLASRAIIINTDNYKEAAMRYMKAEVDSGLYVDDKSISYPTIVEYIDNDGNYTQEGKHIKSKEAVIKFYTYICNEDISDVNLTKITDEYKTYFSSESVKKYVSNIEINIGSLIINENVDDSLSHFDFYDKVYKPFINESLIGLFSNYSFEYRTNITYVAKLLLLIAFPIAYALAGILVYLIPPLCFKRGRMTLGKALYHIGLVDSDYLNVKFGKYLIRFAIFYFAELLLSVVTLLVPFIISFSLMAFSSKKQGFPDYMLRFREIDTSSNKIYYSLEEIKLSGVTSHRHVEFKPESEL